MLSANLVGYVSLQVIPIFEVVYEGINRIVKYSIRKHRVTMIMRKGRWTSCSRCADFILDNCRIFSVKRGFTVSEHVIGGISDSCTIKSGLHLRLQNIEVVSSYSYRLLKIVDSFSMVFLTRLRQLTVDVLNEFLAVCNIISQLI